MNTARIENLKKKNMSNRFKMFSVKQRLIKVAYNHIKLWKKKIRGSDDRSPRLIDPWCGKKKSVDVQETPTGHIYIWKRMKSPDRKLICCLHLGNGVINVQCPAEIIS